MFINGRAANSDSIVLHSGQKAEIEFPFGRFELVFNPGKNPMNITLTSNPNKIIFDGTDNPLGIGTTITIPFSNGKSAELALVAYAIGEGQNVTRMIHYTLS